MSKHTPGPWMRLCMEREGCRCGYIGTEGEAVIAKALFNDPSIPEKYERLGEIITIEEADANMNLIAAAPELLEALKQTYVLLFDESYPHKDITISRNEMRDLIAKAESNE